MTALRLYNRCLEIKRAAYAFPSIHIAMSLAGLADTHLGLAKAAAGAERARHIAAARAAAEEHAEIARALGNSDHARVAAEVLADVCAAEGRVRPAPRDKAADSTAPVGFASGATASVEPATRRCYNFGCPHNMNPAGVELLKCARCTRVYYCGAACQRAAWPAHKAECVRVAQ